MGGNEGQSDGEGDNGDGGGDTEGAPGHDDGISHETVKKDKGTPGETR